MKDLKITPGTWKKEKSLYSRYPFTCFITSTSGDYKPLRVHGETEEEMLANADFIIQYHNTYQRTGMTASELEADRDRYRKGLEDYSAKIEEMLAERAELEKQRDELLEALKALHDSSPIEGSLKYEQAWLKANTLIESLK